MVNYLESKGYEVEKKGEEYTAVKGDKRLRLIFNASMQQSSLKGVDDEEDIEKYKGRPDISLVQERPLIFECKYSPRVSYITMGRFKIMAYTYEYNPSLAILVYPGLESEQVDFDSEDGATRKMDAIARGREGILDFRYNGHLLYMAIIDPLDEDNISKIDKIIGNHII